MATFYAFKETRLNLESVCQSSTVQIRLPGSRALTTWSKAAPRRSQGQDIPFAEDENAFKFKYLASVASIYHREHHKTPKSFLWRLLEDSKVLSINVVDVSGQSKAAEANLTLRLSFPSPVQSGCVALSDSPDHDILSVFVLLESNHLYTLTLRPEYFRKVSSTEDNVAEWCKIYSASAFGIASKTPHRLAALTADELLISQYNGELLRLVRKPGSDGAEWTATQHSEGGVSLRNIIRWGGAPTNMKYENGTIEYTAVTSIATPSTMIDGFRYVFTVSLDHKLRVWNLQTNKIVHSVDILNQTASEGADTPKHVIQPSTSAQLVRVYGDASEESALCVTYSPIGTGEFKFWSVRAEPDNQLTVKDRFPNNKLHPLAASDPIWTVADFAVVVRPGSYIVWVLWKNNLASVVQSMAFDTDSSIAAVQKSWKSDWETMATETVRDPKSRRPSAVPGASSDVTDDWLRFILTPGRFTTTTLETCLTIFERGMETKIAPTRKSAALPERLCSVIASKVKLGRKANAQMGYEDFRSATEGQWNRFYLLLDELDRQREEALSMVVDPIDGIPWVVVADGIAPLRACSELEKIWHNQSYVAPKEGKSPLGDIEPIVALVKAANELKSGLSTQSPQMLHDCKVALKAELFEQPALIGPVRLRALYDKCDFANQVGDDEFDQLKQTLNGFQNVTPQVYEALFRLMTSNEEVARHQQLLPMAEFGNKMIVKGVQETVELHRNICIGQLILLILIESEINHTEEGIGFDTAGVFDSLLTYLKRLELVDWLASSQITLPLSKDRSSTFADISSALAGKSTPQVETVTVLEGILRHLFGFDMRRTDALISTTTETIGEVCDPEGKYEIQPSLTQCFLLKNGRPDLAADFSRFTEPHPFDVYIEGRVQLALNDAASAATLFKKAAYGIGFIDPHKEADFRSGGYLEETERNLLNAGMPQYYSHIVALYDKERIYSHVIDFAHLGLQFIPQRPTPDTLRTELLSRLFNAAIQTSRWDLAHSTLSLFTDTALQHSSLRTLVTKMCESSNSTHLLSLPFIALQPAVDAILTQKCAATTDVIGSIPYHKILYAWRIQHSDFRGAAAVSLQHLQRLKDASNPDNVAIEEQYIVLLNALGCVDPKNAWILNEEPAGKTRKLSVRKVVTLADVRKEYQAELDRIAAIENNQFEFAGEDMEVDML
ncbi:nucleoporin Nup120/160-domain-containing protein [Calycina marina]|uniref:Nucleoporin Nup120/160-domain-containing protein n=1 Tax=Calycina marina TaxID=1763456 RepID=A0A9P7ZBI5_9HELO|nr:nucleoporin Nup120/160-domain-containing protein [Calycina marina]